MRTPIEKKFLQIIDKCFPKLHKLHNIFNRNTVKVSYSTTQNFGQIICRHNKQIVSSSNNIERQCNCEFRVECPLEGKCLTKDIIYQATVKRLDSNVVENYVGLTSTTFKQRYNKHNSDFRNNKTQDATTLSTLFRN